eukprot:TRINITY_DN20609_c0_g1_i1.p1 TRINITY_DN20609_c0_g1~~TRINITY_DN20609_c0_g1_i1.p1  ORF type:complete len:324 (+),score=6.51 TRINITY_DN20609_c0_g1_i1:48-1019(+)
MADRSFRGTAATAYPYLAALVVQIIFSLYQLMTRYALRGPTTIDVIVFSFFRSLGITTCFLIAAVVLMPIRDIIPRKDLGYFLILGLSMACNLVGMMFALKYTTSTTVAVLQVSRPVFAAVISQAMGIETFETREYFGIAMCVAGALLTTIQGTADGALAYGSSPLWGLLCVCIHSCGQAIYVVLQPYVLDGGHSHCVVHGMSFSIATLVLGVCCCFPVHSGDWYEPTTFFICFSIYSVLFAGGIAYVAVGVAAKELGGTSVMVLMLFQALTTICVSHFFLGEQMHPKQIIGGIIIAAGVFLYKSGRQPFTTITEKEKLIPRP